MRSSIPLRSGDVRHCRHRRRPAEICASDSLEATRTAAVHLMDVHMEKECNWYRLPISSGMPATPGCNRKVRGGHRNSMYRLPTGPRGSGPRSYQRPCGLYFGPADAARAKPGCHATPSGKRPVRTATATKIVQTRCRTHLRLAGHPSGHTIDPKEPNTTPWPRWPSDPLKDEQQD